STQPVGHAVARGLAVGGVVPHRGRLQPARRGGAFAVERWPMSAAALLGPGADVRDTVLKVNDLHVRFDQRGSRVHAVNGLSYQLRAGRTLAIIGESGSGKTVSTRALMGLLPPTATVTGSARLDGVELVGLPEHEMR